jgi:hypothetical protein
VHEFPPGPNSDIEEVGRLYCLLTDPREVDMLSLSSWLVGAPMHFHRWKRREFITLLGGAAAWPVAARAQTKRARIGWFTVAPHPYIDGFRQGLRELGWVEGENLAIEPIYADGHPERLPRLASVLARNFWTKIALYYRWR